MVTVNVVKRVESEVDISLIEKENHFEVYAGLTRLKDIEKIFDSGTNELMAYKVGDKYFSDIQKAVDYLLVRTIRNNIDSSYDASISRLAIVKRTLSSYPFANSVSVTVNNATVGKEPEEGQFSIIPVFNQYAKTDWKLVNKTGGVVFYSDQFLEECVLIPPGHEIILEGKTYYEKDGRVIIKKDKKSYPSAD